MRIKSHKFMECEHDWYRKDKWKYWICEKCGAKKTHKQHLEEYKKMLIELNKKFREWGYKGNFITIGGKK